MEREGSLPHSQAPGTCPNPEPDPSSPYPLPYFLKIHLNIILPSTPGSPNWYLSLRFSHQKPVYVTYDIATSSGNSDSNAYSAKMNRKSGKKFHLKYFQHHYSARAVYLIEIKLSLWT